MKNSNLLLSLFLIFFLSNAPIYSQENNLVQKQMEQLAKEKFLADFFSGFFTTLGVTVQETGEKITVTHRGDFFDVKEGINEQEVEFFLPIQKHNITDLIDHAKDGKIDEQETFLIFKVLFTPMTAMTLKDPLITKKIPRVMSKIENNIHVTLFNPDKTMSISHTLIYLNREWIVVPGFHGTAKRKFELNVEQALNYQKHAFDAIETNSRKNWRTFKRWYLKWREDVSVAI